MMKRITLLLIVLSLTGTQWAWTQDCNGRRYVGADLETSVLGVVMGNYPHFGAAGLEQSRAALDQTFNTLENAFGRELVQLQLDPAAKFAGTLAVADSSADTARLYHYEGLLHLVGGDYTTAVSRFNASMTAGNVPAECKREDYRLIAQYLDLYGDQVPIFSGFNNGFFNYACDSLRMPRNNPNPAIYNRLIESLLDLAIFTQRQPAYLEMLGDLMTQNPDQITANWFSAVSYLQLAKDVPAQAARLEEKAIHALEAPRTARSRFDSYQFTKLGQRLDEDRKLAEESRAAMVAEEEKAVQSGKPASEALAQEFEAASAAVVLMRENEPGALPNVIREADRREAEKLGEERKFAGNVDLKEVKGEKRFNYYALVMIAVVIGAVIVLWRKLNQGAKERNNQSSSTS